MVIVLDCNILVMSLTSKSAYVQAFTEPLAGGVCLCHHAGMVVLYSGGAVDFADCLTYGKLPVDQSSADEPGGIVKE